MDANNKLDQIYFDLVNQILYYGTNKSDRTGTGTKSIFDYTFKLNMQDGFPILTSKKMYIKGIVYELMWFLGLHLKDVKYKKFGRTNIKYLVDNNVNIWIGDVYKKYKHDSANILSQQEFTDMLKTYDDFALEHGQTGPIYGQQWRSWKKYNFSDQNGAVDCGLITSEESDKENHIDQISILIEELKNNPDSRRLIVSSWNCADLDNMLLPPCHYGFQCWTRELTLNERIKYWCDSLEKDISYGEDFDHQKLDTLNIPKRNLSLKWTQRSADVFFGLPYNVTSYALLLHLLAKEVNMIADELIFSGGDVHLYNNIIPQVKEQLYRQTFKLPNIKLKNQSLEDFKYEDLEIINYQSDKILKGDLSN